ncbi:DUF2971 domain-containing protein [Massilia sp.]|uniref:DUF2971 domain-containing protein n=1 Tax=Massilia sp. TaxID=1882437 RepID=UPI00289F170D|nr:DUF2971 domain-containing protein [Massilia sp.]
MTNYPLPPPVLYSYSPGGSWLSDCLAGLSLRFSSRRQFNDPFDSRPAYQVEPGKAGREFIHKRLKRIPSLSPSQRARKLAEFHRHNSVPRPFGDLDTIEILDSIGILCLTEEWDEPLFWGHYGAKHTGICIGFRTDRDVFQLARKISYQPDLPVIVRPRDTDDEMISKTFLTKSSAWEYEKEWRIIKQWVPKHMREHDLATLGYLDPEHLRLIADQRGAGIYSFDPTAIESLTMGMFISPEHRRTVIECVKTAPHSITLYETTRDSSRYKINRHQVKIRR